MSEILHLCTVWRYYAYVYSFVQHSLPAYFRSVGVEYLHDLMCLTLVYPAECLAYEGFSVFLFTFIVAVNPLYGVVVVKYSPVCSLWRRLHLAVVEPMA